MRKIHLLWIVPASVALLLALAVAGIWIWWEFRPPQDLHAIGGKWQIAREVDFISSPDKHFDTYDLYRAKDADGRQRVDAAVTRHQFYAPDCVVYQTIRPGFSGVVFAVCGDRTPVAFATDTSWNYEFAPEGLLLRKEGRRKPIERIIALALEQPPYRKNWEKDVSLVASVEIVDKP